MAAVTLTAKLVDKVSAPANKATKSLDKMNKAAGRFDKGRRFKKAGDGLKRVTRNSDEAASSLAKASMKGNLMANAISAVSSVAKEAALAVLRLGVAFGAAVGRAASFGENLQFSLTRFLGSSSKAKTEIAAVLKLSNKLGLDFQKSALLFKSLVSAGFTVKASKGMIAFKADLLAVADGAKGIEKVESAFFHIEKAMAQGRMEADGFQEVVANLPINKLQIMQHLSKRLGKSVSELMKTDLTKLPVKELLAAMQDAALAGLKASKLGDTALAKQKETISGMISLIKNRIGNIPDMIATRLEGSGLKTIMEDVLKALESDEAKAILDGIVAVLNEMAAAARKFWPILKSIMGALVSMGKTAMTFGDKAAKALGLSTGPAEMLAFALKSIAVVLTVIVGAATALGVIAATPFIILYKGAMLAIQGFMSLVQSIAGFVTQMKSGLTSLGTNMISGLVQGIKSGARWSH